MITYPLNNIEYTAEDAELYNSTRTSGIYDPETDFIASCSGTDLQVTIGEGLAWIQNDRFKGKVVALKEDETVVLPAPPTGSPRYDVIAIRFSALQNQSEIVVISGDPAIGAVPNIPGRNENATVYELFLYAIKRETNSYVVYEEDIEDLRSNPNYCGIMADAVTAALPLIGGRMKGPIDMDYSVISNVGYPTSDDDAASKRYVDSKAIPAVDYIVNQGVSNGWTYRKYESGVAECWKTVTDSVSWGTTISGTDPKPSYYSTNSTLVNFINGFFVAIPCIETTCHASGYVVSSIQQMTETFTDIIYTRFYGGDNTIDVTTYIHAIGRWK